MSEGNDTMDTMIRVCPNHEGGFDCTPFATYAKVSKSIYIQRQDLVSIAETLSNTIFGLQNWVCVLTVLTSITTMRRWNDSNNED